MKDKGFTLIELMVVMVIIGILAGLTLTGFAGARKSARDGQRKADMEQIRSALEMCRSDTGGYPAVDFSAGSVTCPYPGGSTYTFPAIPPGKWIYSRTTSTYTVTRLDMEIGGNYAVSNP